MFYITDIIIFIKTAFNKLVHIKLHFYDRWRINKYIYTFYNATFLNLIIKFFTFFEKNIHRCCKLSSYSYQYDKIHTYILTT